jgi:hypothetical protein
LCTTRSSVFGFLHLAALPSEGVRVFPSRRDAGKEDLLSPLRTPRHESIWDEFGPVVEARLSAPRHYLIEHPNDPFRGPRRIHFAGEPLRAPSSRIFKARNRRPPYRVSLMESTTPDRVGLRKHDQGLARPNREPLLDLSRQIHVEPTIDPPEPFIVPPMSSNRSRSTHFQKPQRLLDAMSVLSPTITGASRRA